MIEFMEKRREVRGVDFAKMYSEHIDGLTKKFRDFILEGIYIEGDYLSRFEKELEEYMGVKHVIGTANGTASIELCLRAEKIGKGDEVITVGNTYYATLQPIYATGAIPVFCDVDENCVIDIEKIERLVTNKTRAIIPVHLYGIPANLMKLRETAEKYHLIIIEDGAHAFGSKNGDKYIGYTNDYCSMSFYPTKNMGAFGDAGVVITNDNKKAERVRELRYFTKNKERSEFEENALHARMDALQACLMSYMLPRIRPYLDRRKQIARLYVKAFEGKIQYIRGLNNNDVVPYVFPIVVKEQESFMKYMKRKGVWAQIHYKPELHKIGFLNGIVQEPLIYTEFYNNHLVSLPVFPTLTDEEIQYVIDQVFSYWGI